MPKRSKKMAVESYDSYPVKILDWQTKYSLHLNKPPVLHLGPLWEYGNIDIQGELIAPEKVEGRNISIVLLADRKEDLVLAEPKKYDAEWSGVGSLSSRGNNIDYLGSVPFSAFEFILNMLQAGKFKYIILHGKSLRYGKANITSISFSEDFAPDDY